MISVDSLPVSRGRIRLRVLRESDARAYAEGARDDAVRRFAHLPEPEYTTESAATMIGEVARRGIDRGVLAVLAIADSISDEFVGSLVLFDVTDEAAEVGFWLSPAARGLGCAGDALAAASDLADRSGLGRLIAKTMPDNDASRKVLTRAGFREVGRSIDATASGATEELITHVRLLRARPELPIVTDRLRLRLHQDEDVPWLHSVYSQTSVTRYLLDSPWTVPDALERVSERKRKDGLDGATGALALVVEKSDGTPVGDVALWSTDAVRGGAEVGWVLDPNHRGHGYAFEAVSAVIEVGFCRYGLHRIAAQMDARNSGSAALAERLGMTREALFRQDWWSKGEWTDTAVYALLAADVCDADRLGEG